MRRVVSSREVPHMWANQTQDWARSNNLSFQGSDLRSYSTVIARIIERRVSGETVPGDKLWLVSSYGYSITTSGHQSAARQAVPFKDRLIEVDRIETSYGTEAGYVAMINKLIDMAHEALQKASRARKNTGWWTEKAETYLNDARRLAEFTETTVDIPELDLSALKARSDEQDRLAQAEHAARYEAEKVRNAERLAEYQDKLTRWKAGENVYLSYSGDYYAHMRLDGDEVQTTRGVRLPLQDVRAAAKFIVPAIKSGDVPNKLIGRHVGPYTLQSIQNGVVTIGCHQFEYAEILRFAEIIGQ